MSEIWSILIENEIKKMERFDEKERVLLKEAEDIISTSPIGQLSETYSFKLNKALKYNKKKCVIWNLIRGKCIPNSKESFWQSALKNGLSVCKYGEQLFLDFGAKEIRELIEFKEGSE